MPIKIKILAAGVTNVTGSYFDLYAAPAAPGLGAIVDNLRLVNVSASSVTVNVYFRQGSGGSPLRIYERDKSLAVGDVIIIKPDITLNPDARLQVITTGALDYSVFGLERT